MGKISSLYNGFIRGKSTALQLGPNNPKMDTTSAGADAQAILGNHNSRGVKSHPKVDGPARKVSKQPGRRVNGSAKIRGGQM